MRLAFLSSLFPLSDSMSLTEHIDDYVRFVRDEKRLSATTVARYRQELVLLAAFLEEAGLTEAKAVRRETLLAFLNRPTPRGTRLRAGSRNHKLIVLRGFFSHLVLRDALRSSPTDGIPWVRAERTERPSVTRVDVERLLRNLTPTPRWRYLRNRALIQLLFHCGLRLTELLSLSVPQIDLKRGLLLTVHRKGGHHQPLPLNNEAKADLTAWLGARKDRAALSEAVFLNPSGETLTGRAVQSLLWRLSQKAGFSFIVTPHILRHSFATELLRHDANLEVVRRLMGHSSIVTTSRYLHPDQASLRRAVDRLGRKKP